jgi:hypothetical protein
LSTAAGFDGRFCQWQPLLIGAFFNGGRFFQRQLFLPLRQCGLVTFSHIALKLATNEDLGMRVRASSVSGQNFGGA